MHDVEGDGAVLLIGGVHHHRVQGTPGDDLVQYLGMMTCQCIPGTDDIGTTTTCVRLLSNLY